MVQASVMGGRESMKEREAGLTHGDNAALQSGRQRCVKVLRGACVLDAAAVRTV